MIKRFLVVVFMMVLSISCNQDTTVGPEDPGTGGTTFSILLLAPAGGESYKVGESKAIRWTSNTTNSVKIEYTTNGGTTFTTISEAVTNIGIYNWVVPATISNICLIRVSDATRPTVNDVTDNFFAIVPNVLKSLSLTRPNGGDTLVAGTAYSIQWVSANIANISLHYSSDNGGSWNTIISSYPADSGKYNWQLVPDITSSDCRIKISETGTDTLSDISDNRFVIRNAQTIRLLSPNSGENLTQGSSYVISWTATDINTVKLEYSTNDGTTWNIITASTLNDGSFDWNPIPEITTTTARIRVSDAADGSPSDISDGPFAISILASISVISPGNGETITVGSRVTITWSSSGKSLKKNEEIQRRKKGDNPLANNVAIAYSTNDGISWTNIVSSIPNTGSFAWDPVPNAITSLGRIRVRDVADTTVFGLSPGTFIIAPQPVKSVAVLTPNGGESWDAGSDQLITWSSANITFIKIELTTNNGQSWSTIASNILASNGSYAWLGIPSTPSQLCKIRLSESPESSVSDQSDNVFAIAPQQSVSVVSPNGDETLNSGGNFNISWTSENIENVKIEFTTNNGFTWSTIVNATESDGFYTWSPVPSVFSTNCKIKISDAADGLPNDISNAVFSILAEPILAVTNPNGGERIQTGSAYEIRWLTTNPVTSAKSKRTKLTNTDDPGVSNVRIEFSTDGGAVWSDIVLTTANNGFYTWNPVPNISSALCKIRISDAADGFPTDQSDSTFVIYNQASQSITITAPNGGEQLTASGTTGISWTSVGVGSVNIELTSNNGVTWSTIVNNIASTGFYSWNPIPSISSNNCRIRISDATDSIPSVMSNSTFTIIPQPSVEVLSPNGGETFYSGTTQTLRWTSEGLEKVKLELTTNNGSAWSIISDSTESDGSFDWTVPVLSSSLCKIRVSGIQTGIPSDISNAIFTITNVQPQSIIVVNPNGGQTLTAGVPYQITWNSSGIDTVKIEYSTNNGVNWSTIVNKTASNGSYNWTGVPTISASNAKIRISDAQDGTPSDESDAVFSIVVEPQLQITAPNGGESILAGSVYTINWSTILSKTVENLTEVKIEFSSDAGLTWSQLASSVPNNGSFSWNPVPNISSTTCRIKVSDAVDGSPADISDSNFTVFNVTLQAITVTAPNGGEVLQPGSSFNITWNSSGIATVNIELSTNNGLSWVGIINNTESDGFYQWVPSANISSTNCKIRIYDATDSLPVDESNATFTILPSPTIAVISPNGGEQFNAGSPQIITWSSQNIVAVKIEFTSNNGASWVSVVDSTESDGQYLWTVPFANSSLCKIRISDQSNGFPQDISDNIFSVTTVSPQSITVTSPNGGESFPAGSSQTITWTSTGVDSVKLEYTTNNGVNWTTIVSQTESDGSYLWSGIPNVTTTNGKIRVSDATDGTPSDESNGVFSIAPDPTVQVLSPNGGETWSFGTTQNILWLSSNLDSVKIEFTTNNGSSWSTINNKVPSTGSYSWTIPNVNSLLCKVRISDPSDGVPFDISDNSFVINNVAVQTVRVTSPNGGEIVTAGVSYEIRWQNSGIDSVKIEYSTNNGQNWNTIIGSTPGDGSYIWASVPSVNSANATIRISDATDGTPSDQSDDVFNIVVEPQLLVTAPNGNDSILAGSVYTITWSTLLSKMTETIANVKIEFSSDVGISWTQIAGSAANSGSYSWNPVPNLSSSTCRIKISDAVDGSPADISDSNFTIYNVLLQTVTVTAPNGGEVLQPSSSFNITWNSTGISTVSIELSTNNGLTWSSIISNTESDGFHQWVPSSNISSTNCKIRIFDAVDNLPVDESNTTFTILPSPSITVLSPNGGEQFDAGSSQMITWSSQNIIAVKIEFTSNNGASWSTLVDSSESDGQYIWIVPMINSALCKIRISDESTGFPQDVSDNIFTISTVSQQSITITSPNGGESISSGSSRTITWTSTGVDSVAIEYTTNNGVNWTTIVSSTESNGSYLWSGIPNVTTTNGKIRISDATDGTPNDESDGVFSIAPDPTVQVLSPNGGETLLSGSSQDITWISSNLDSVKIEFTTNNGSSWSTIINKTPSTGSYTWTIPNVNSLLCKVRVSDPADGFPFDLSDNNFTMSNAAIQTVKVTSPNGSENIPAGVPYEIRWQNSGIDSVKIEYTTNNGQNWTTITNSTAGDGSYIWSTVPSVNSANGKIRVSDATDGNPSDESDDVFNIVVEPEIQITAPNGNDSILAGSVYTITWSTILSRMTETIANVKLEFSSDAGLSWLQITGSTANTGSYSWNPVPNVSSTSCRIKVSDAVDGSPADISDNNFTVYNVSLQSVAVTAPNGGEVLQPGSSFNITWSSSGISTVNIELSTNNGLTWSTVVNNTESDGFYQWVPASSISSTNCKVRIYDATDSLPVDESNATFTILPSPQISILSPNGGEQFNAGSYQVITWSSLNIIAVKIEFTLNNGASWVSVVDSTESDGQYVWTVPAANSLLCKIRISDQTNGFPQDVSDNIFSVSTVTPQSITVTSPNGGESFPAGSNQTITWTSAGVDSVKIEYTTNNGQNWTSVISSTESDGFYLWSGIPAVSSTNCKLRITDVSDDIISDISDAVFSISPEPAIVVLTPNGGEIWTFETSQDITWTSENLDSVKIEFTTNNGFSWTTIISKAPSTGSYTWTLPNINSLLCRVRISDPNDGVPFDVSDNNFTLTNQIQQSLTVTVPNGGENFESTSSQDIEWTSSAITTVKIEYSTNNGLAWIVITDSTESDGLYEWNPIPSLSSTLCRVRISDMADGTPVDQSDNTFSIIPNKFITVSYPDGGENLVSGTVYNILWSSQGVTSVKIEYRIGNTGSYEQIVESTPSDGSYEWSPTIPASFYKVRISNADATTPLDESNGTFTVSPEPSITLSTPDGGQSLQSGSSYNINWVSTGLSAVKIELTTNNGASWQSVVDSTESDGVYTWLVDSLTSSLCKIRISDEADGLPSATSANVFSIYSSIPQSLTVSAPNGGEIVPGGTARSITWVSAGVDSVKIELSTNNGQDWSTVVSSTSASGFYYWNPVPTSVSTNCIIKISDAADGFPFDVSDAVFTIAEEPSLRIVTPNGGESWLAGTQQQIRWTSQNVPSVDIEFSSNNGATWSAVASDIVSTGTYTWSSIPIVNSDQCRIRVMDAIDGVPVDESDSIFAVVSTPYLRVIFPNGGGQNIISDTTIIWTSVGVTNVDIELTLDNAATAWTTIAANIPSTGAYFWPLIAQVSANARIRITAVADTAIRDMSDGTFNVGFEPPDIRIINQEDMQWNSNEPYQLEWESSATGVLLLEYSTDQGINWFTVDKSISVEKGVNKYMIDQAPVPNGSIILRLTDRGKDISVQSNSIEIK